MTHVSSAVRIQSGQPKHGQPRPCGTVRAGVMIKIHQREAHYSEYAEGTPRTVPRSDVSR